jgi:hypothetical protein
MSYSLARKEFQCKGCVPNRTFRMLVGGDVLSVKCDDCDTQAPIKVKPPPPDPQIEEQKTQASSYGETQKSTTTLKSRGGKRLIINAKDITRPGQNPRPDSASR